MTNIKEKFERFDHDMAEFRRTHKALKCGYCDCEISPGWSIYVHDDNKHVYCSPECACAGLCVEQLNFQMDGVADDGYRSFFESKEGDDDNDT